MFSSSGSQTPHGSPKQGMSTKKIGIGYCLGAFLMLTMLAGCMPAPDDDPTSWSSAADSSPEASSTEEDEETGESENIESGWDSDQIIADIRVSLESGEFSELADVQLQADDDDPGHVTVVTTDGTPFLGDAGAIIGDTCEDVPELERVTVVHTDGATVGPVDTRCQE